MNKYAISYTALALALATPGYVLAQQDAQSPAAQQPPAVQEPAEGAAGEQQQLAQQDQQFVEQAAMISMEEIQAGQLAIEKAESQEVQDFGRRMVEDHTASQQELQSIAQQIGAEVPDQLDQQHQQKLDQLSGVSGADFDRQYIQSQVEGHQTAIEAFTAQRDQGENQDLVQFAESTLPTLEEHHQSAMEIQQSLSSGTMAEAGAGESQQQDAGQMQVGQAGVAAGAAGAAGAEQTQAADTVAIDQLMDKPVVGSDGEELGEVADVIIDPQTGEAQQLVISSGGFLGIGAKEIAVDFQEAQLSPEGDSVSISSLTQADVEGLPEFQRTEDMTSYRNQQEGTGETEAVPPAGQ